MKVNSIGQKNTSPTFNGIYNNKLFKRGFEFAADNGSLFAAGTTVVLSTAVRPVAILATPNTDKENKKYACAKSISSSLVGYMLMLSASLPIARALKNIDKAPEKYLSETTAKNLQEIGKPLSGSKKYIFATQLFKLGLGFLIAVPKSVFTSNLIPPIVSKIFPKAKEDIMPAMKSPSKDVSFTGKINVEPISHKIGEMINTKPIQKLTDRFYNTNFEMHIMSLTDILATGAFIFNTQRNKKIKKENRKTLIYNSAIATGLSIPGSYALNTLLKNPTKKFIKNFSEANKNSPKLDKYIEGIKIAKSTLLLGGVYYIAIPFVSTFLADRIKSEKD